jgi:hypothetical protein
MISKQINKPKHLSNDEIFEIIEFFFVGRFKTTRKSVSRLEIRRLYNYPSYGWNTTINKLNFNDFGNFQIINDQIKYSINLAKQITFWTLMMLVGIIILWKLYQVSLIVSFCINFIPVLMVWINGLYKFNQFVKTELDIISKRLKK